MLQASGTGTCSRGRMSSAGLVPPVTRRAPNASVVFAPTRVMGTFCSSVDYNYDPVAALICAMYIAFGVVYTLFGEYGCLKMGLTRAKGDYRNIFP